jgi:pseudomonalisin/xanthomonalisin
MHLSFPGRLAFAVGATSLALLPAAALARSAFEKTRTRAHPVAGATLRGTLAPGETVDIVVALKLRNPDKLDAKVKALTEPGNTSFRHWLGRKEIERDHAPTATDARAVANYLTDAHFTNVKIASNRLLVTATGSAEAVRRAFHTEIGHFVRDGREGIANTADVEVPAPLGGTILSVLGLQTLNRMHPVSQRAAAVQLTGSVHGINPVNFPLAYGAVNLPSAASTAVGIITEGDMTQTITDLHQFEANNNLPTINPTVVAVGGPSGDKRYFYEWNIDSQTIQGMAGGQVKQMLFYTAQSLSDADITLAFNQAVAENIAAVINVSLGECESDAQADGSLAADDQIFQLAIAQGQTFSASSGDSGSNECVDSLGTPVTGAFYPASSPYVIAVGGTTLYTDANGNYGGETVWSGTGGSPSLIEAKPAWQNGVVSGSFRGVPDVAFDADPGSGTIVVVNGANQQWGGTSVASPIFVGSWARIQSANNARLGFPATWIYSHGAQHTPAFHDVTSGSNGDYSAGVGWDYTTGFGSFDVAATAVLTQSAIVVSASPATITPGESVTLAATVSGNAPTGTVQFQINGVNFGAPVTLVSGGATLTTSQLTLVGSDMITAFYSGDLNNAGGASAIGFTETVMTPATAGDVPLPPWSLALLAAGLMGGIWQTRWQARRSA